MYSSCDVVNPGWSWRAVGMYVDGRPHVAHVGWSAVFCLPQTLDVG